MTDNEISVLIRRKNHPAILLCICIITLHFSQKVCVLLKCNCLCVCMLIFYFLESMIKNIRWSNTLQKQKQKQKQPPKPWSSSKMNLWEWKEVPVPLFWALWRTHLENFVPFCVPRLNCEAELKKRINKMLMWGSHVHLAHRKEAPAGAQQKLLWGRKIPIEYWRKKIMVRITKYLDRLCRPWRTWATLKGSPQLNRLPS